MKNFLLPILFFAGLQTLSTRAAFAWKNLEERAQRNLHALTLQKEVLESLIRVESTGAWESTKAELESSLVKADGGDSAEKKALLAMMTIFGSKELTHAAALNKHLQATRLEEEAFKKIIQLYKENP